MYKKMDLEIENKIHLYLVRHGESLANVEHIICGQKDSPLSPRGIEQANKLAETFQREKLVWDRCYSSPLARANRTAQIITNSDDKIIKSPELLEINAGDYSDWSSSRRDQEAPLYRNHGINPELKYPNGESLSDLDQRTKKWLKDVLAQDSTAKRVLIVGHWGSLNLMLQTIFNIPIEKYSSYYLLNCTLTHVSVKNHLFEEPQMHRLNYI